MVTQQQLRQGTLAAVFAGFALGGLALAGSSSPSSDFVAAEAAAFTEADANGDGKLTQDELNAGRSGRCGGFPPPGPPF